VQYDPDPLPRTTDDEGICGYSCVGLFEKKIYCGDFLLHLWEAGNGRPKALFNHSVNELHNVLLMMRLHLRNS